jgi:ubiquinone/menaquinone biosynthesis C-methylase UbiE
MNEGYPMNLPDWLISSLRDPKTKESLSFIKNESVRSNQKNYPIVDGILSIVYPESLEGIDEKMNRLYKWLAPFYDLSERILGRLLSGEDMVRGRAHIVDLLQLSAGTRLLEVSPGPGVFQHLLRSSIGRSGELVAVDLSLPMLRQCQLHQKATQAHLIHANGAYLPFADETFDALFHFGGVNLFNNPHEAVTEFVRVVKPNGIVAYGDEGFAAGYPDGWRKKILIRMNPGFTRHRPNPPEGLCQIVEHVVYNGLGYLVVGKRQK